MEILISLLIIVAVVIVWVYLVRLIPFPAGLEVVQTILIVIGVVYGLMKVFAYLK